MAAPHEADEALSLGETVPSTRYLNGEDPGDCWRPVRMPFTWNSGSKELRVCAPSGHEYNGWVHVFGDRCVGDRINRVVLPCGVSPVPGVSEPVTSRERLGVSPGRPVIRWCSSATVVDEHGIIRSASTSVCFCTPHGCS